MLREVFVACAVLLWSCAQVKLLVALNAMVSFRVRKGEGGIVTFWPQTVAFKTVLLFGVTKGVGARVQFVSKPRVALALGKRLGSGVGKAVGRDVSFAEGAKCGAGLAVSNPVRRRLPQAQAAHAGLVTSQASLVYARSESAMRTLTETSIDATRNEMFAVPRNRVRVASPSEPRTVLNSSSERPLWHSTWPSTKETSASHWTLLSMEVKPETSNVQRLWGFG